MFTLILVFACGYALGHFGYTWVQSKLDFAWGWIKGKLSKGKGQ